VIVLFFYFSSSRLHSRSCPWSFGCCFCLQVSVLCLPGDSGKCEKMMVNLDFVEFITFKPKWYIVSQVDKFFSFKFKFYSKAIIIFVYYSTNNEIFTN